MGKHFASASLSIVPPLCSWLASITDATNADAGGDGSEDNRAGAGGGGVREDKAAGEDAPLTTKQFAEYQRQTEAKFKKLNDENRRLRQGSDGGGEGDRATKGKEQDREGMLTRAEYTALRNYDRELDRLESAGFSAEEIGKYEETSESLPPEARVQFLRGIREGFERGKKAASDTATRDREVGAEDTKTRKPAGSGGKPPPKTKAAQGPESWSQFVSTTRKAKSGDKEAAKQLEEWNRQIKEGAIDLDELRATEDAERKARRQQ